MNTRMHLQLASIITETRDDFVVELFYGDEQWGELNEADLRLTIFPRANGLPWQFNLQEVQDMLALARSRLTRSDGH